MYGNDQSFVFYAVREFETADKIKCYDDDTMCSEG